MNKKERQLIFDKHKGKCAYCGTYLIKGWNIDHIKPKVNGGTNEPDNLNPSCKDCNNYKGQADLEWYRKQLHKMLNEKPEYLFKSKTKMQEFNLEYQYQLYLQRMALSESTMHPQQKIQLCQTFFGASGQMLILLRDELSKLEEEKAMETLQDLINQVGNFFLAETNKMN